MSRSHRFVRPSRRQFLAAAGATAAAHRALLLAGEPARAPGPSASAADGPGIGVVGQRYQGSVIAARAKPYGRIVGIADVDRDCLDLTIIEKNVTGQTGMAPEGISG